MIVDREKEERNNVIEREEKVCIVMQDQVIFFIFFRFIYIQQDFKKYLIIANLAFILLSSVRADAMLYLIDLNPYNLLLAYSTNAKFFEAERVE